MKELPAYIAPESFLQPFRAVTLEVSRTFFDPQLPDKQAGFGHSQYITDQVFKITYDVEHRFEEISKSGMVLKDVTAAHGSLLYGTKTLPPPLICCYFHGPSIQN